MKTIFARATTFCLLIAAAMALSACGGQAARDYYADYYTQQLDTYPNTMLTYDTGLSQWSFNDDVFDVTITLEEDQDYSFNIVLHNTSDGPLVIDWNRVFYVDINGQTHHAIHNGVDYFSPMAAQHPTVLAAGATLRDLARPANLVHEDGVVRFAPPSGNDIAAWGDWPAEVTLLIPVHSEFGEKVYRFPLDVSQPY